MKPNRTYGYSFFCLAVAVLVITGCSTKKNTAISRAYHNLTSRFNGFYYATESYKEGVEMLEKKHVDRYDKILPVFKYGTADDSKTIYPQMDKTFKKSSAVIERHSMLIKNVEHVKWIDENYLLIGKSHFYKRDYFAALEVFDYVSKQYKKSPSRFEARLWMTRIYNELGIFDKAQTQIDFLKEAKEFPSYMLGEFAAVQADFYLKQEIYPQAIFYLQRAIALHPKKRAKTRYLYILAQLYQKTGEPHKAGRPYQQVIKMNPPYVMAFNAKINLATANDGSPKRNAAIKKQLTQMLKDDKNIEFQDQIYYALSEIALQSKDTAEAISFLKLSTKSSVANDMQKGRSYLRLADLFFEKADYRYAQAYYDSSLTFINKDISGYDKLVNKRRSLTVLVNNMNTITVEDSLQRLAMLSEEDRNDYIEKLIARLTEEESAKKELESVTQQNALALNPNLQNQQNNQQQGTGSTWYFYNPSTLSFGFTEFLKRWGTRKLEDNWRRMNKASVNPADIGEEEDEVTIAGRENETSGAVIKDKEHYLKSIPLTKEQQKKSTDKIIEAYYSNALIYKEQLLNPKKAAETLEELLKRFPKNKYELAAYYQLHRLYMMLGDQAKSDKYKNILLNNHPESEYAQIIKNPEFMKTQQLSKNKMEEYYQSTYQAYNSGNYQEVINKTNDAESKFPKSEISPKLDLLRAMSIGKTKSLNEFEIALKLVIAKYPQDPVKDQAQEMLNAVQKLKGETKPADPVSSGTAPTTASPFTFEPATPHFFVIIITDKDYNPDILKKMLSDFNSENFSLVKLDVSSVIFDTDKQMFSVKTFADKTKGMDYYTAVKNNDKISQSLELKNHKMFIINQDNYAKLYKDKNAEAYTTFFEERYRK